ncbi:sugar ABC transporter ATP-binding protein [Mesorhizobium argentiipisi]|uniref:Sugar ABC transporter ATP-binding protein n=1 Tax=Mesorhizobium argentiipisi TaxID=3015175 RepID=A0ABU8KBG4_9HYPH
MVESNPSPLDVVLRASDISKSFGRTQALKQARLELASGEIHGLLGANGAGKSTLSRVLAGYIQPDKGEIVYRGQQLRLRSTRAALDAGIALVSQETSLAPDLSVLENVFLPELGRRGRLSFPKLRQRAMDLLDRLGQKEILSLDKTVRQLSAAQRQLVEIMKALALNALLIVFDEPTTSLSPKEVERLFDIMAKLRESGAALVFVSHRLEEVFTITDRVTVMREGQSVATSLDTASLTQGELIRLMVGQELSTIYSTPRDPKTAAAARIVLDVEKISSAPAVRDVSFSVREGEILGIGGLVGAGRSETLEAIFGLRKRQGGIIRLDGKALTIREPRDAIAAGIGFVAEDRRIQSIVPDMTVKENLLLAHLGAHRGFGLGYRQREAKVKELLASLDLPPNRLIDSSLLNFSGGMQQKIIIARWLLLEPKVLILDEPTKGVDIRTRSSIYSILRSITAKGISVVVVSSDFDELLGIAERIVVISDGLSIADVPAKSLTEEKLTLLAAPRTSTAQNTEILRGLTRDHGGASFWALLGENDLICLSSVVQNNSVAPGFAAGEAVGISDTQIPKALRDRATSFVCEEDGSRATILVPVTSRRGHDFGWIGLSMPGGRDLPSVEQIRSRISSQIAFHNE